MFRVLTLLLCTLFFHTVVCAHGSLEIPISRIYHCYKEGPENLKSASCQAMITRGEGKQSLYDWDMINQFQANDRHRQIIPDGKLCSAGRDKYAGMDLTRNDWFTTNIEPDANGNFTFVFLATVHHASKYIEFYLTKDSYDILTPLKWSDLEDKPFCRITNVTLNNGRYQLPCPLPKKSGRRLLYMIWQRSDSPEAFYACSDVNLTSSTVVKWKALDHLKATFDVKPNTKINLWLMKSCHEIESHEFQVGQGQNTANQWPYYLAQAVNAKSTLMHIGQLSATTGEVQPVQNAMANQIYLKDNDLSQYYVILNFQKPDSLQKKLSGDEKKQLCAGHASAKVLVVK